MTSYIVVFGLIVVVVLVVILVALGLRASRAGQDDDDWMDEEPQQPRGRRAAPPVPDQQADDGYGHDAEGYGAAPQPGAPAEAPEFDRRVAGGGGPLAAPPSAAPAAPPRGGSSDELEDDDYWATITFDKPKFPWQHDDAGDRAEPDPAADPLNVQAQAAPQPGPQPVEPPGLTQPVPADMFPNGVPGSTGPQTGPQQAPQQTPGSFAPAAFGADPSATASDPLPVEQPSYEQPSYDQPVYEQQQPSYDQPSYDQPAYDQPSYDQPSYGRTEQQGYPDKPGYGESYPDSQPTYGTPEPAPSYDSSPYGGDPLGGGLSVPPAATPSPASSFDRPSDPLGLPLGRAEESAAPAASWDSGPLAPPPATPPPAPPATPAAPQPAAADTDGGSKLPTVDELLQRIQSDRQRSAGTPAAPSSSGETQSTSYGSGLPDPLGGDPLSTGPTYGSSSSSWSSSAPSTPSYDTESSGTSSGGYSTGGTGGFGTSGDGYPSSPYGDPLSTGPTYGGSSSYGTTGEQPSEPSRYGDFSGSSYGGSGDPLGTGGTPAPAYDPNATQAYGSGYFGPSSGGQDQQGGYPAAPGTPAPENGGRYGSSYPGQEPRPSQDDWENHRDYRR